MFLSCDKNEKYLETSSDEFVQLGQGIKSRTINPTGYLTQIQNWDKMKIRTRANEANDSVVGWSEVILRDEPNAKTILKVINDKESIVYFMLNETILSQYYMEISKNDKYETNILYTDMLTGDQTRLLLDKNWNILTTPTTRSWSQWGKDTASCLSDAYSNHGWSSVFAFVATAFVPECAAGLAALCAYKNRGAL